MFKLRLAILGATAALALGSAGALAMEAAGTTDSDSHGDAVASAARNCAHGPGGVHGACVSSVARTEGAENNDKDQSGTHGKATAPGQVCKAADKTEAAEPTGKSAGKAEDKSEHQAFAACVQAAAAAQTNS